ncbi:ABC transporter substrate-binding protein [Rubellimicrobium roseum]|uniref:Solute-binding protein family 5 domain-containing protein n=1 Tax=Rubellimicrobium roseum TaxID=687525 RepID=A0A5C4NJI5_9RHOB|nr:ABC transporter substrate-binding protein [Rubellimicrobium roseum]TNC74272.1 hypothetical protein FHG71_03540 [Rubellimicrobium roseum]
MIPRRRPDAPLRRLDSRVSRRGLLGAGVLAGVLAASGVPLQARARGGVLRLAVARPLPQGPGWAEAPAALGPGAVYDTLTEIGPTGELSGELAQSWEAAPGARAWFVALRPGVRFHDGTPLRASDVIASLERHRRGPAAWALSRIERIEPQGPQGLRIELHEGDPDLPFLLADPALVIGPEGRLDGVGTGLYRVAETQPEDRLRLDRVPSHWKDGRAGWFDAIEALHRPAPRDRLEAVVAGEAHVTGPLPPALLEEARAAGLGVTAVQGNRQLHVTIRRRADGRFHELLRQGVDRAALAALHGGTPAADHPLGPLHPALSDLPPPPLDPEAARALQSVELRFTTWDGCPTEDATFRRALAGPWAAIRRHPDLLRALASARATDGPERAAHYAGAQAVFARLAHVTVAAHVPAVTVHARALAHDAVSPLAPLDGGRLAERWWFA